MKHEMFLKDDFDSVADTFFSQLRESGDLYSDLSYWYESDPIATRVLQNSYIAKYRSDYNDSLKGSKQYFIKCIEEWDLQHFDYDNITICSSATSASLMTQIFLKDKGVKNIYFETPAYYGSLEHADVLGINKILIPTYFIDNFEIQQDYLNKFKDDSVIKALWICQPRFGLGYNQDIALIDKYIALLNDNDYLIIDEATEQLFPSLLHKYNYKKFPNIIKYRSFFKPIGINGPRISFIIHHEKYRKNYQNILELVQGAIDCFSLEFAIEKIKNIDFFRTLLTISNNQVRDINLKVFKLCNYSNLIALKHVNGYIGSLAVKLNNCESFQTQRIKLLMFCKEIKVPVILGSSMYFAVDDNYEYVRITYFNSEESILKGVSKLIKFNSNE